MSIKLVVGLGNPGSKYEGTRHNIGRRLVEQFAKAQPSVACLVTTGFMNTSGVEVARIAAQNNIRPEEILVIFDEFQIPLGQIRILKAGSDGGHNGLKSIVEILETQNVPRLRIGIGPLPPGEDPADFVLERFTKAEEKQLQNVLPEIQIALSMIVEQNLDVAMNKYNNRTL